MKVARPRRGNKTVRFTQVVEHSGRPQVHTLWRPPDQDPELQRAQKGNRVMTIEPGSSGSKIDVGTVGFERDATLGQFLIFPKSLKAFDGARVVGVKFDLVAQPKLAAVDPLKHSAVAARRRGAHTAAPVAASAARPKPARITPVSDEDAEEFEPAPRAGAAESSVVPFERPPRPEPTETKGRRTRTRSHARPSSKAAGRGKDARKAPPGAATLIREIRAAMKELERGKSVAAYQRLGRAIANRE